MAKGEQLGCFVLCFALLGFLLATAALPFLVVAIIFKNDCSKADDDFADQDLHNEFVYRCNLSRVALGLACGFAGGVVLLLCCCLGACCFSKGGSGDGDTNHRARQSPRRIYNEARSSSRRLESVLEVEEVELDKGKADDASYPVAISSTADDPETWSNPLFAGTGLVCITGQSGITNLEEAGRVQECLMYPSMGNTKLSAGGLPEGSEKAVAASEGCSDLQSSSSEKPSHPMAKNPFGIDGTGVPSAASGSAKGAAHFPVDTPTCRRESCQQYGPGAKLPTAVSKTEHSPVGGPVVSKPVLMTQGGEE